MRVSKNFIPGLSDTDVSGDYIAAAVQSQLDNFLDSCLSGFSATSTPSTKWYRIMAAPKNRQPATPLIRVGLGLTRLYVGTQRRRLIPRG